MVIQRLRVMCSTVPSQDQREFVEWITDLRLWEAEHKDETKPRFVPRFCRQPKQIIKTLLGHGNPANFTVDYIIETLRNNGYGDTLEEENQEALDNNFDTRQGKAEANQDHVNRKEMMPLSRQNSTKIAPDENMHGYWLIRASALSEQQIAGIRIVTEGSTWTLCCDESNPADKERQCWR